MQTQLYRVSKKESKHLVGCEMKSLRAMFKTKMLIANLNVQILLNKSTDLLNPEIIKMLARGLYEKENSTLHFATCFSCH